LNALPVARPNDWLGSSLQADDRQAEGWQAEGRPGEPAAFGALAQDAATFASDTDPAHRLSAAQHGFLALRLEAALGRLAATETLLAAERLHGREGQAALSLSERAFQQQHEAIASSDQRHRAVATELERLKQSLHETTLDKIRQDHQIAGLTAALANRTAEIERLREAGAAAEADLRAVRARQNSATDVLHRECQRLEEALQGERRDKVLLQRALDLARANRRALHEHIEQHMLQQQILPSQNLRPSTELIALPLCPAVPPASQSLEQASADTAILLSSNGDHHAACN